jgi:hypothetical protein
MTVGLQDVNRIMAGCTTNTSGCFKYNPYLPRAAGGSGVCLCSRSDQLIAAVTITKRLWLLFLFLYGLFLLWHDFNSPFFGVIWMFLGPLFRRELSCVGTAIDFSCGFGWHDLSPFVMKPLSFFSPGMKWVHPSIVSHAKWGNAALDGDFTIADYRANPANICCDSTVAPYIKGHVLSFKYV